MCAIFGSKKLQMFIQLYEQNLVRGDFAYGGLYLTSTKPVIVKTKGREVITEQYSDIVSYYSGHTQAPTSNAQTYDINTSHPFLFNNWIVSHNGVLTNHKHLRTKYNIAPTSHNIVDSSIIPYLLDTITNLKKMSEIDTIVEVLSLLEGTHSTTIFNSKTNNLYITRCGSTLYRDNAGNYSSTHFEGSEMVSDGNIYKYVEDTFKVIGSFNPKSPFFI